MNTEENTHTNGKERASQVKCQVLQEREDQKVCNDNNTKLQCLKEEANDTCQEHQKEMELQENGTREG